MADVAWFEEPGKENIARVLGRKGTLPVRVHAKRALDRSGDRKQLAREAREAIGETLGFKLHAHSPIAASE
jgi:1-acyl-sn-glycerol-3-phosphate acyltransferase